MSNYVQVGVAALFWNSYSHICVLPFLSYV